MNHEEDEDKTNSAADEGHAPESPSTPHAHAAPSGGIRPLRAVLAGGVLILIVAGVWWGLALWFKPKPKVATPAVPVAVAQATAGDVPIYLSGPGTVQAFNTVTIHSRVDGTLEKIAFTEGQDVKSGDLLAQIDPRPFQAQLEQAKAALARDQANLANAQVDLKRYQQLFAQDSIAKQQLDTQSAQVQQDQATVQSDQAQIDYATVQLDYTRIISPISGRTGVRLLDAGNIIHAADANGLVVVTQVEPITVVFTLPGDQFSAISQQMRTGKLNVTVTAHNASQVMGSTTAPADAKPLATGTLTVINNQIDQTTGAVELKAVFPNKDHALWPGQFVDVRLLLQTLHGAVSAPAAALQRSQQGEFIYVVGQDGKAQLRPVTVSTADTGGANVLIQSGVNAGEQVVVDGQLKLHSGTAVQVAEENGVPQGTPANPPAGGTRKRPAAGEPAANGGSVQQKTASQ